MLLCKLLKRVLNDYDHTTLINSPDQQSCSGAQNLKVKASRSTLKAKAWTFEARAMTLGLEAKAFRLLFD